MKRIALVVAILLAGCTAVPVVPNWPDVPEDLKTACPNLEQIDPTNDKLSAVVETVTDNYQQYYDCKAKVDNWIEWYQGQQKIWKTLK
jgi:hypothetical protein